jgi:hypothetical protein
VLKIQYLGITSGAGWISSPPRAPVIISWLADAHSERQPRRETEVWQSKCRHCKTRGASFGYDETGCSLWTVDGWSGALAYTYPELNFASEQLYVVALCDAD